MGGCPTDLTATFSTVFCATYDIFNPVTSSEAPDLSFADSSYYHPSTIDIFSLTFRFANADGGITTDAFSSDNSDFNEFPNLSTSGQFEVTLTTTIESALSCVINSSDTHQSCFQVYLAIPSSEIASSFYQVSLTAINGIRQDPTLAPVPKGVPEPATLLLMGTGLTALAGRRLRRKKTN
jgi:hypothetical protein